EEGRSQIFEVAEAARQECTRTEVLLKTVQAEMEQAILDVEELTRKFTLIRVRLLQTNRDFQEYSEEEKRQIYEEASEIREALTAAKERERMLRVRRDNLEQTLAKLQEIAAKAERLVSQVGIALGVLSSSILDVNQQIEHMHAREIAGQEMLKGQELERKRMAGALHDGPVQDIAHLIVQLEIVEWLQHAGRYAEAKESFQSLKSIAQGSVAHLRRIIYDLNPMTLDDLGLVLTINNFLDNLTKQTGVETRLVVLGNEVRLDSQVELSIFRTVQEAVANCRKHSQAKLVVVTLEFSRQHISVVVQDDGIGFDVASVQEKLKSGKHYGLLSMQSRVSVLGGSMSLNSQPGKGAKVLVKIPLRAYKED
ncbi:MAG: histidine kinase, partial [Firmicutes bacterium]|nr:histidine kinase [Bacillota bacterium]